MRVHLEGKEYWIEFRYDWVLHNAEGRLVPIPRCSAARERTACLIRDASSVSPGDGANPVIAEGEVVRHFKDPPNRELARKAALKKALVYLDIVGFSASSTESMKARRALFWGAYLDRKVIAASLGHLQTAGASPSAAPQFPEKPSGEAGDGSQGGQA